MSGREAPLQGVRVLALTQFGAGPFGTAVLADLGAEVIKIEDPESGGDVARYVPPYEIEGDSLYFQAFNRGKKSLALNLRHAEGRAVFHDLVRVSDVVCNNLRGDQPAKLGLTYEHLRHVNPRVVCGSLSGFGRTGPRAAEPGYDPLVQACAGYMALTGEPGGPPTKAGVSIIDFAGGYALALGLMVGLFDARRTGAGRDVDVSLLDTALAMLSYMATWSLNAGWEPVRTHLSAHQTIVPAQTFATKDGWLAVFPARERFYRELVGLMGLEHLAADPRFAAFADRLENRDELLPVLEERFRQRSTAEWLDVLRGRVPCAPVNSLREALNDEQVLARGLIVESNHPVYGRVRQVGCPIVTEGAVTAPAPGPALGQHTDEVLGTILGYPPDRIRALRASGTVA
ncbi:MAG: CoA transferase [Gemmatimonadetes bacterium]|nr:CoA transferase [Gemmatimonadota bacterium]